MDKAINATLLAITIKLSTAKGSTLFGNGRKGIIKILTIALFFLGVLAAVLFAYQQYTKSTAPDLEPQAVAIDFAVYPESDTIVVQRGKAATVPLKVEAPVDAAKTLQLRVAYERGNADPEKLQVALSKATLVLSEQDVANGKVTELGKGVGLRDAGMLTLTPADTLSPGTYTFAIEAEQQADGTLADALVSGTVVTVVVE